MILLLNKYGDVLVLKDDWWLCVVFNQSLVVSKVKMLQINGHKIDL